MNNFIRYNVVKPYLSIFIASFIAGQSAMANGEMPGYLDAMTAPAPKSGKAAGETGLNTTGVPVIIVEAKNNKRGFGLSDAKKAIQLATDLAQTATNPQKETINISGMNELQRAFAEEAAKLKQLKVAMDANVRAVELLQKTPMDETMRLMYGAITFSNMIPVLMATNDAKGTPWFLKGREVVRSWAIALPMIGAAWVRAQDPAAAANINKINEELIMELSKLREGPGVTSDVAKEIHKIMEITRKQVGQAGRDHSKIEAAFTEYGLGQGTELKIPLIDLQINAPNAIMLGSVLYAVLQSVEAVPGPASKFATRAKSYLDVAAQNSGAIATVFRSVINGSKAVAAGTQRIAESTLDATGKVRKFGSDKKKVANWTHVGPDAVGNFWISTKKEVQILEEVKGNFEGAVLTIKDLIKQAEANAIKAK